MLSTGGQAGWPPSSLFGRATDHFAHTHTPLFICLFIDWFIFQKVAKFKPGPPCEVPSLFISPIETLSEQPYFLLSVFSNTLVMVGGKISITLMRFPQAD